MTPSEVAAVLGLDEQDAVRVVPFEERPFVRRPKPDAQPERSVVLPFEGVSRG